MSNQLIGGISVQLAADVAKLKKDMTDAEKVVDGSAGVMSKSLDMLKVGFAGILTGVGAGVGLIGAWVKTALDAADATKQFSQKTGVAAEDVAGLQLAFKQGGVEAGSLQGAISKMSKQMVEGSAGFKTLGVETRNADGTMRNAKDVLYDVADATAGLSDGIAKTTTLQQIFGKSAADLIPTLNDGSEGLRNMADMAQKLGLVISSETAEQADKFNDTVELLGMGLTGVGRQIAAQLLPTLTNLADSFLTSMTEGDRLTRVADILAAAMKGVYSVVLGVIEVFSTFGKLIGGEVAALMAEISGLGTAIMKVFQGDFKGAAEAAQAGFRMSAQISKESSEDISKGWQSTGTAISKAWSDTGSSTVDAMTGMQKKGKELILLSKEQEEAAKRAADAETKRLAEVKKLIEGIDKQIAVSNLEAEAGQKLTTVQKQALDIMLKIQAGTISLTLAEKKEVVQKLEQAFASEAHQKELENEKKQMEENRKENDAHSASLHKSTEAIAAEIAKQKESNQMFGKTAAAIAELEIARLNEQAVAKDRLAVWAEEAMLGDDVVNQYKEQARGLRELATLKGDRVHLEIAKESADAWKKTSETIGASFTDSLFRAFESGKNFGDAFMDSVKNLFKTTVLQVLVKPIQSGMNNVIGSMLGGGGDSSSGGGGGGGGGGMDLLSSIGSVGGILGGGFGAGVGATLGGVGTMGGLTAGASLIGTGTMAGVGSGAMMMAGAAMPWIAAAMLVAKAMDYKVTPDGGGLTASLTSTGTTTGKVGSFSQYKQEGGLGGGGNTINREWAEASSGTTDYIIANVRANTEASKVYARMLGLNADALDGFTKNVEINTTGMDEASAKAAIDAELTKFATEQIAFAYGDAVKQFALEGETAVDTFKRLASIEIVSQQINQFGGVFSDIATMSIGARQELISFAGGIEEFARKTKQFVDDYYSDAEKFGMQAKNVNDTLASMGIDAGDIKTKDEYRALVESQDRSTEEGRKAFAMLLDMAPSFAGVGAYMEKNNQTLDELAANAPATAMMQTIFDAKDAEATKATDASAMAQAQIDATTQGSEKITTAVNAVTTAVSALSTSMNRVGNNLDSGQSATFYTNGAQA